MIQGQETYASFW